MMVNLFLNVSTQIRTEVVAKVIQGGELKSKKGVNLPTKYHSAMTERYC
jgi:pyruvate kinase